MPRTEIRTDTESTRERLLDAAEQLFIAEGSDAVSLRAILREAGQKNQSAMQYHFGNREGLIKAIRLRRMAQLEARRMKLLEADFDLDSNSDVRECCAVLVRAPFLLCRENPEFRELLGMMGPFLMSSARSLAMIEANREAGSLQLLGEVMRHQLAHLSPELLMLRIENAQGAVLLAISRRARNGGSFRGARAELFYNNLTDQLAAMLGAPISPATEQALADLHKRAADDQ